MNVEGKLVSPEFADCTLPLTAIINGRKKKIGSAYIRPDGYVTAKIDDEETAEKLKTYYEGQLSIKLNPEVRLEPTPARWINTEPLDLRRYAEKPDNK